MTAVDLCQPNPAQCVHHGMAIDAVALAHAGIAVIGCSRSRQLLRAVAEALHFPGYYGHNWDALEECLLDLSSWWPTAQRGWVLVVDDQPDEDWNRLVAIWPRAATVHAAAGRSLHLVFAQPRALG
ncbi:MAG: barstar family protein [Planctomycetota bacterium]